MRGVDLDEVLALPCMQVSVNQENCEGFKRRALPILCHYFSTVFGHLELSRLFPMQPPKLYDHEYMYLERQHDSACWKHCFFALLGGNLHPMFTYNNWIIMSLDASIDLPMGTEELLEPGAISSFGDDVDENMLRDVASHMSKVADSNQFCDAVSIFACPKANVERFINCFPAKFCSQGLSKVFAHRLFSSLSNPLVHSHPTNIYVGAQRIQESGIRNVENLIEEFQIKRCNVIIFCCELQSMDTNAVYQHFVVVWLLDHRHCLRYFDPNKGMETGSLDSPIINGFRIPISLTADGPSKSRIFVGDRRCAFYFNARLDDRGMLIPEAMDIICTNINERLRMIIEKVFKIQSRFAHDVVSLRPDNFIADALFQTQKLYVQPSLLRSCHTGNLIGYGLFVKPHQELIEEEEIGHWNGHVIALSTTERKAKIKENPDWQFYAVTLQLGPAVLESVRMEANLPITLNERYFGK